MTMVAFTDAYKQEYGVEPTREVVSMAASTFYKIRRTPVDPEHRCGRVRRDEALEIEMRRVWKENRNLYSYRKLWRQVRRKGIISALCTTARLMAAV